MKIKTIARNFNWIGEFDQLVNTAQEEGWVLTKREVIRGTDRTLLYAELVQLDPEPEPTEAQPLDPITCLEALRKFCAGSKCDTCPLEHWCPVWLPRNEGPADWELPDEEAGL